MTRVTTFDKMEFIFLLRKTTASEADVCRFVHALDREDTPMFVVEMAND